jgi:hypothetical protein
MGSQGPVWRMDFCFRWIQNSDKGNGPNPRILVNIALPGSLGAVVYQDYCKSHYKNGYKIQTPKLR